ncbi:MAG: hypothetical protein DIU70_008750 [Bacillota bacterium]
MPAAAELMPLVPGRRWRYRLVVGGRTVARLTQEVLLVTQGRSGTLARLRRQVEGDPPQVFPVVSGAGEVRVDGQPVLRDPLTPGTTWLGMGPEGPARYRVAAVAATVEVPAGRFVGATVIRVTSPDEGELAESTYVPGVGLVRHRFNGPLGWGVLELEAWEPGEGEG